LFEFIDEHELEDAIILGHSMGGKVAMRYALENPDYLTKLIVVDISLRKYPPRDYHKKVISAMKKVDFSKVSTREEVEKILEQDIDSKRIRAFIMKNLYRKEKDLFAWRMCLDAIANNLDEMFDGIEVEKPFLKPTLIIRGGLSDYILASDIPALKEAFVSSDLKTIPNTSHWVHAEAPQKFYDYIVEFLKA
ncbi:MAG: alpha/beta fold hydrolase, partial [Bacteroidales bacterium]|nr:alpha/beta fold hydrolase [Bacteroidales bacterium]